MEPGVVYPIIPGRISFVSVRDVEHAKEMIETQRKKFFFSSEIHASYLHFAADFGPVNLACVHNFVGMMREKEDHPRLQLREIVYYCDNDIPSRTNSAFLLAAYLVVEHKYTPAQAWQAFAAMDRAGAFAPFHDATFAPQTYKLTVLDCLRGLARAMEAGWYDPRSFDAEEYERQAAFPLGDVTLVCPDLIAFRGPQAGGGRGFSAPRERCTRKDCQWLSPGVFALRPEHYVGVLRGMGVTAVVRLNDKAAYDSGDFTREGFDFHDLFFDDCSCPDEALVQEFFKVVKGAKGRVAVHCNAGLGRTGTLAALHLMQHHSFTAAEAIGWLRIVRPGSVIGPQQLFLDRWERASRKRRPSQLAASEARAGARSSSHSTANAHSQDAGEARGAGAAASPCAPTAPSSCVSSAPSPCPHIAADDLCVGSVEEVAHFNAEVDCMFEGLPFGPLPPPSETGGTGAKSPKSGGGRSERRRPVLSQHWQPSLTRREARRR